jgi:hypothetical protein
MKSKVTICVLAWLSTLASFAGAQTFEHLSLDVEGKVIRVDGGEQPNTALSSGALEIGKKTSAVFSKMPNMCGFAVSGTLNLQAVSAWTVEVTPLRVDNDAVTFRLHWTRSRSEGGSSTTPGADVELTLRPGQSIPVDVVPLSPSVKMPYEQCGVRATLLRVGVNYWPRPLEDRRLVGTDMWLVERLADGTERGQALSLRGSFNRATPFYFDTVTEGNAKLEFFGEFTLTVTADRLTMKLEARSRLIEDGRASTSLREGNLWRSRVVNPTVSFAPGEVVAVELPRLNESDSGAFAGRTFSIRIRSRQIR